jgi:hypothetical protein
MDMYKNGANVMDARDWYYVIGTIFVFYVIMIWGETK